MSTSDPHERFLGRMGERPELSVLASHTREVLEAAERSGARWRYKGTRHHEWRLHADGGSGEMLAYGTANVVDMRVDCAALSKHGIDPTPYIGD